MFFDRAYDFVIIWHIKLILERKMVVEMNDRSEKPLLTVAVNTYNRWDGCTEAVLALLRTWDERVEIIVVDDCSKSSPPLDLLGIFERYGIRYYRHKENRGLAAARNTAIGLARGKFFSFCDDDDVWTEDMIPRFLEACESAGDAGEDVDIIIGYPQSRQRCCDSLREPQSLINFMVAGVTPPVAAQVYRLTVLLRVGGYRECVRTGVDHDLWITLSGTGCRCQVLFDVKPRINKNLLADRMTTNEEMRRLGIERTLEVWEPEVKRVFGEEFFDHLRDSYRMHLNYKFFKKSFSAMNFRELPERMIARGVVWSIVRKLFQEIGFLRYCGAFPCFHGRLENHASRPDKDINSKIFF
ncbi:glycosyltransferase family 2 protein [Rhodovulum sp. YNF3179]|uniref:glycosyltransferase family 2 protein n=1 Tax=Rhodovulum sp. YNF3179 TaxID=3425127 RepID=UPI003D327566